MYTCHQIVKITGVLCLLFFLCAYTVHSKTSATANREKEHGFANLPATTAQVVLVVSSGSNAKIYFYEKTNNVWHEYETMRINGFVGENGVSDEKIEGDLKTPLGMYRIGSAFYIGELPQTKLRSFAITDNTYWVDDPKSRFYNRLVEGTTEKDWNSAEHMMSGGINYSNGFVIEYNAECVPGAGSAIFFHVSSKKTTGCVAASAVGVKAYLAKLDINSNPYIIIACENSKIPLSYQ